MFRKEFKTNFNQELNTFTEQIDHKLSKNKNELQEQKQDLEQVQIWIGELEDWNIEVKQALLTTLKEKLTDRMEVEMKNEHFWDPRGSRGTLGPRLHKEPVMERTGNTSRDPPSDSVCTQGNKQTQTWICTTIGNCELSPI